MKYTNKQGTLTIKKALYLSFNIQATFLFQDGTITYSGFISSPVVVPNCEPGYVSESEDCRKFIFSVIDEINTF